MTRPNTTGKEGRRHNSGFAKKRVQWLIEHSTSHRLLWYIDSFVLRNPLLRKAANRYAQLKKRANRTNSTFGFCRYESQRRKNQKSYFLPTLTENNEN
jgi:hypothetical protein